MKFFKVEEFVDVEFDTFFSQDEREPSLSGRGIKVITNNGEIVKIWMGHSNVPPASVLFNGQNMNMGEFQEKFPTIYKEVFRK